MIFILDIQPHIASEVFVLYLIPMLLWRTLLDCSGDRKICKIRQWCVTCKNEVP